MLDKSSKSTPLSNLDDKEIAKFDRMANQWWDPKGKYKTALAFNRARLAFIVAEIERHYKPSQTQAIRILDVGSGGGLISESLAALGYDVTGVDPSSVSVQVAQQHARQTGIEVNYVHGLVSDFNPAVHQFDVVINAEVVEHVPDQQKLITQCCELVKPEGLLILATLNRTILSWFIAILGAEYVLRYLPVGTHSWQHFVKPSELKKWASCSGFSMINSVGLSLNPLSGKWSTHKNLQVNYVLSLSR